MSKTKKRVLKTLVEHRFDENDGWMHGFQIEQETTVSAGGLYAALYSLEDEGWLETKWDELSTEADTRRRRSYRVKYDRIQNARKVAANRLKSLRWRLSPQPASVKA